MEIIYILPALVPFVLDVSVGYSYYKNILTIKSVRSIIAFAAGLVISAALFEMIPHIKIEGRWFESNILFVAVGFFSFLYNRKIGFITCLWRRGM